MTSFGLFFFVPVHFTAVDYCCYCLGYCYALVSRIYEPSCAECYYAKYSYAKATGLFFGQLSTLNLNIVSTRKPRVF